MVSLNLSSEFVLSVTVLGPLSENGIIIIKTKTVTEKINNLKQTASIPLDENDTEVEIIIQTQGKEFREMMLLKK